MDHGNIFSVLILHVSVGEPSTRFWQLDPTVKLTLALLLRCPTKVKINVSFAGEMAPTQSESLARPRLMAEGSRSPAWRSMALLQRRVKAPDAVLQLRFSVETLNAKQSVAH